MVADLRLATEIVVCPIVREADGLALSSRNVYLSADERAQALTLSSAFAQQRRSSHPASETPPGLSKPHTRLRRPAGDSRRLHCAGGLGHS